MAYSATDTDRREEKLLLVRYPEYAEYKRRTWGIVPGLGRSRKEAFNAGMSYLSFFFALGAIVSSVACVALLFPGSRLESMWRLNPQAHQAFLNLGGWAVVLMIVVAVACALSAAGLWIRAGWGYRLALAMLTINVIGDTGNAIVRADPRTLMGVPIAGALIAYLLSARVRAEFAKPRSRV